MKEEFVRTEMLLGSDNIDKLSEARVAVFGVGGVGGYVVEGLARSGIGSLDLIDMDTVSVSNINRQIIALHSTVGRYKTEVMRDRIMDINSDAKVNIHNCFFLPENENDFDFSLYDYVVDAVDTVTAKIEIIRKAKELNIPVISSMGAGNKLSPTGFIVSDISETSVCPLAKVMRKELKNRGISDVKVVYSKEKAMTPYFDSEAKNEEQIEKRKRATPGSISFVPSVVGMIIASEVIKDICK